MKALNSCIERSLHYANPWADPALARALAAAELERLEQSGQLTGRYSSATFINEDIASEFLGSISLDGEPIGVDRFLPDLPHRYREFGMHQAQGDPALILDALEHGLDFLAHVPAAATAVASLVRAIHPLALDDPNCDISYSEPGIPFSIFIGLTPATAMNQGPRLAEGILHEAMHLQLSLIERHVALAQGAGSALFSPWRASKRPVSGVLHALYVFRAIQAFMIEVAESVNGLTAEQRCHCAGRVREIGTEVAQISGLRDHSALTPEGQVLVAALLDAHPAHVRS